MKKLWLLLSLLLLTGCQDRQPTEMQDVGPEPAAETAEAEKVAAEEAEDPVFLLADADGVTVGEIPSNMVCSEPEPTECLELLSVQANPEGASIFGPMAQTDDQYRFYCYMAVAPDGEDLALSVACRADEAVVSAHCPGDQKPYLLLETPEGQVLQLPDDEQRIPLAELWDGEARWLVGSADGLLALSADGQAAAFDLEGQLLWTEVLSGTMEAAYVTASNEIRVLTRWESLPMLQAVDLASGRLTPVGAVPEALCQCRLYPGDRWGYDLLALDEKAIFGWRAGENTVYRLCILSDVSLEADQVKGLACLGEDSMLLLCETGDGGVSRMFLWASPVTMEPVETPTIVPLEEAASYDKSTAVVKREEELGLTMEVPEEYAWDLMCNLSPHELFSFYDGETRAAATEELEGYGWCWSVLAFSREEYEARYEQDFETWVDGRLIPTDRQMGRDDSYMYIYRFPTDVRYDLESQASVESYYRHYLIAYAMLTDFMARNGITPSADWDASYRQELLWQSTCNGDFKTVEFGCGDTSGAEPALLELAARIPNLYSYDQDIALTWHDVLIYRLNCAYLSSDVGHSEADKEWAMRSARPVHEASIYYSEPGSNESVALSALYDFTAQLQEEPALAEACQSEAWAIYAAGDYWYLSWPGGRLKTNPAEVEAEILENFEP